MTIIAMVISMVLSTVSLAYAYWQAGLSDPARWIVLLGIVWLLSHWRRLYWVSSLMLFLAVAAAGYGVWSEFPTIWMLLGALGALLGWDLSDFSQRLRFAAPTDDIDDLERRHLARVGVVAVIGAVLAYLSVVIQINRLAFEVAVGLILLAAIGLTRLVIRLRKY
ncbi:MAG TPA: hypothetical protein VLA72_06935 [Anaerolineales bacterium]|nr:hypothetical protein [Anaerolineales bacterium]